MTPFSHVNARSCAPMHCPTMVPVSLIAHAEQLVVPGSTPKSLIVYSGWACASVATPINSHAHTRIANPRIFGAILTSPVNFIAAAALAAAVSCGEEQQGGCHWRQSTPAENDTR